MPAVRDRDWLATTPEADRRPWEKLWADVDPLLGKARDPK